jgi:hypothetical protein
MTEREHGWQDAQEDYAHGADFAALNHSTEEYRVGYMESWRQCEAMSQALELPS